MNSHLINCPEAGTWIDTFCKKNYERINVLVFKYKCDKEHHLMKKLDTYLLLASFQLQASLKIKQIHNGWAIVWGKKKIKVWILNFKIKKISYNLRLHGSTRSVKPDDGFGSFAIGLLTCLEPIYEFRYLKTHFDRVPSHLHVSNIIEQI